jgi:hypothetical protein
VTDGQVTHALVLGDGGAYAFLRGDQTLAEGKRKDDKIALEAGGKPYLVLKLKIDKVKVATTEDVEAGWEIKWKPGKAKLVKGETELAKCKHYPDTGKLKVKNAQEEEIVVSRDFKKLTIAPLALVVPGLDADRQRLLLLILLSLGK